MNGSSDELIKTPLTYRSLLLSSGVSHNFFDYVVGIKRNFPFIPSIIQRHQKID